MIIRPSNDRSSNLGGFIYMLTLLLLIIYASSLIYLTALISVIAINS